MNIPVHPVSSRTSLPTGELGFGRYFADHQLVADWTPNAGWHDLQIVPYAPIALDPAAAVFHYGQEIFEGSKAFRGVDGVVRLFRVERHAQRFAESARILSMPVLPPEIFIEGLRALVRGDDPMVPNTPGTALYLRPTMIATEPFLGVRVSERYHFTTFGSPVGNYYPGGALEPITLWVEKRHVRAAAGGLGAAKTGANYAASLRAGLEAKQRGCQQVLWLDAKERRYLEEAGTMNLFVRFTDALVTPPLDGTILSGVTRDCVLTLAREWGLKVEERKVSLDELVDAQGARRLVELFGTGTAAVVAPVGTLAIDDKRLQVGDGRVGEVTRRVRDEILAIQTARVPDRHGWTLAV